jgi:hypothetical protein
MLDHVARQIGIGVEIHLLQDASTVRTDGFDAERELVGNLRDRAGLLRVITRRSLDKTDHMGLPRLVTRQYPSQISGLASPLLRDGERTRLMIRREQESCGHCIWR